MKQYNPKYNTKIQPFNISIIKDWINKKNIKELKQWLNEGEPHKRLLKDAITHATISEWYDGIKLLFEKDWISQDAKLNAVISHIRFCQKDEIWNFVRDMVFSDSKLIKKFSFLLFWEAREKDKAQLFNEDLVDFTHDEASSLLTYRYMFHEKHYTAEKNAENDLKRDYLLSKPVLFIPYQLIGLMDSQNSSYVAEMFKKHGKNPIFKTKEELFVFACAAGVYYQSALNSAGKCNKTDLEASIKKEQIFMLNYLKAQGVAMEADLTPKILHKNTWINYNLDRNYGDFCCPDKPTLIFGSLKLKYFLSNKSESEQKLPEKQNIKLSWYWIGGEQPGNQKYIMTDADKVYAENEFEKLLNNYS